MDGILGAGHDIGDIRMWTFEAPEGTSSADLRELVLRARTRTRADIPAVLLGSAITEGKVSMIASANPLAIAGGVNASWILNTALAGVGGRGGGKDDLAQGGGPNAAGVSDAFALVEAALAKRQIV